MDRPPRWFVKIQQHVNGNVDIRIREGGYGGAGRVEELPSPGPGEIIWFGDIELSSPGNSHMGRILAEMWSAKFAPLRTVMRTVKWRLLVHGHVMSEWWIMVESRRVANATITNKPGMWGQWNPSIRDFTWRPVRLQSAM